MMRSIFSTLWSYFREFWYGLKTANKAAFGSLPYLISASELRKEVTEQYPDPVSSKTEDELPARTRGLIVNEIERCTGCGDCVSICPVKCIRLETEVGPDHSKRWVSVFDVDNGKCIFCGICVNVCGPKSLTHSKVFEGATTDRQEMVANFGRGKVSDELKEKWRRIRQSEDIL
jgi:formate hydrogenlyase subunit 6/NADH:ubiquinone oxidoreductase subunit I